MTNPFYDPYQILVKVYGAGAHLKIALAETPVEELHRTRTVKTVYGVLENDSYLSLCLRSVAPKSPKQTVRIVMKIALYWLIFLGKPKYMVTDTAVELLKKLGKGGAAGFANAALRAFDAAKVAVPAGDEGLAATTPYPLFAIKLLRKEYGDRTESIVRAKSSGVTVRFVRGAEAYLSRPHLCTPFPDVYIFENFARDAAFSVGDYTFQSVGSVAICAAVEPCGNMLDACAAPGGKSVLLAGKCARVTACELHEHRVGLIRSYCERMGAENVTALQKDSSVFDPAFEGAFDGVLCDVPCSGFGTVSENPDLPLNKTEADLAGLNAVQRAILENCSRYVKAGGALYYSTCSLFGAENDAVVRAFLSAHPEYAAEELASPLAHEKKQFGIQFLPDTAFGAGFYIAKMRRA